MTDPPSIINIEVEDTGTNFITISWSCTSVCNVTCTIIPGDQTLSFTATDTEYNITELLIGTSYRISVVPSVGMCQGEEKEITVNTTGVSPSKSKVLHINRYFEGCI